MIGDEDRRRGSRGDDEAEAGLDDAVETWAALESRPTYARARTTVLESSKREQVAKIDVMDVDIAQHLRTHVFKLNDVDEDNEVFLQKVRRRMDRYVSWIRTTVLV